METVLQEPSIETARLGKPRHWLRRGTVTVLIFAALVWSGDAAISFLVDRNPLRARITAHLESAFGRPVEVGGYAFSVWGGPVLEAYSVRIGEDSRFGNEYFIRADSISVGLRLRSLLRGHVVLATLSVSGASLNLVRSADGDWNLAEWLPRPPTGAPTLGQPLPMAQAPSPALQFRRIDISDSRIDFKRGFEKLPFALVDVNGSMETDAPGRWRIDMTASPWRAAVLTQQPGVIRVTGHIGGTSSRLRPAALDISWTDASISDFFRLARGDDYGVRGDVAISISAHTEPSEPINGWVIDGKAEVRGLHRWDMASRPDNPSLNLSVDQALLDPGLSELRISDLRIDAPHSNARASAAFNWTSQPAQEPAIAASNFIELSSSQVDLGDALAWVRAFHPGIPDSTSVRGMVDVRARFSGWPPVLSNASVVGERGELISSPLQSPARIEPIDLRYNRGSISLQPATITWTAAADRPASLFRIKASPRARNALFSSWHVAGNAADARGITALSAAIGWNVMRGWDLQGPLSCDLDWQSAQYPWDSLPTGTISVGTDGSKSGGAALRVPFLNLPVEQINARVQMKAGVSQVALASAKAFGVNWTGTFERRSADPEWRFTLSADRLLAGDLDRWLDPRWRESFLDRMLPFLGPPASPASPENLRASGSLSLGEFALAPLTFRHMTGDLRLDGRNVEFSDAKGQFYGGEASGLLRADLSAVPSYHAEVSLSGIDAAELAAVTPALAGLRADALQGQVSIDAKGATRGDLISSLACRGTALADGVALRGLRFDGALNLPSANMPDAKIAAASAAFTCSRRIIQFPRLSLALDEGRSLIGTGSIGFDRSLDLRFQEPPEAEKSGAAAFRLAGTLSAPEFTRVAPVRRGR